MSLVEYIKNNINELGSYASLIALGITIIISAFKIYKKLKNDREMQESNFNSLKEDIKELASSGTTSSKRQDIFIYVNERLASMRHREIQVRLLVIPIYIIGFISILVNLAIVFILKPPVGMIIFFTIISIVIIVGSIMIQILINKVSRFNKFFSEGYLEKVIEHVKKVS